jgi:hypothetical protein
MINLQKKTNTYLDTLGQLPTNVLKPSKILQSENSKNLLKRARSKWYTKAIVGRLLFIDTPLKKYYQRAFYCNEILTQRGNEIKAKYCDTRVCNVCNRIRTAKMIRGYLKQFIDRKELQFVTLTIPNVNSNMLRDKIEDMLKKISCIVRVLRERRKIDINGVRKIEVTYNAKMNTYHPHIHLIVDGNGEVIVNEWLKRNKDAKMIAQDVTSANQDSLNELFKYTTKILHNSKGNLKVYLKALDVIIISLRSKRCFQPFGNIRMIKEEINEELEAQVYDSIPEYDFMEWIWKECDWINEYKETLTGYISPDTIIEYG